jgi:membrane protease YdiL (CAAX protease family)
MLGLWAALTLTGTIYSVWLGYGGRAFAATVTVFAFYFLAALLFASRGFESLITSRFGSGSGYFLATSAFILYMIYVLGTNTFTLTRVAVAAALVFLPLLLVSSAEHRPPGVWQDYATIVAVWFAVKPLPNHWNWSLAHYLWPFPGGRLAYIFTVLLCVNVALACFLLLRRLNNIGYSIGWGHHWSFFIVASFLVFACIAIPLGQAMHFIEFSPQVWQLKSLPLLSLGILFFTAWPEEFLFRGILQNMLSRTLQSDLAAWWLASLVFGFSHITNGYFPNWRYVALASIAGFFYGWTWRKTGSIFASALVHAAVDITWHFLFRTI